MALCGQVGDVLPPRALWAKMSAMWCSWTWREGVQRQWEVQGKWNSERKRQVFLQQGSVPPGCLFSYPFQTRSMGATNAISAVRTIMKASETRRSCSVLPAIRFVPNIRIKHHGNLTGLLEYLFHNPLQACEGHCTGSGPKSCTACKSGFNMNTEHGCLVSGPFVKW